MLQARVFVPLVCVALAASAAAAQVPEGWQKVSGVPETTRYSGVADGLDPVAPDRQSSYAWSMEVLGDHLYVGTNRNVFGLMIQVTGRYDLVGPGTRGGVRRGWRSTLLRRIPGHPPAHRGRREGPPVAGCPSDVLSRPRCAPGSPGTRHSPGHRATIRSRIA